MDSAEELDGKAVSEEDGSGDKEEFVEGEVETTAEVDIVIVEKDKDNELEGRGIEMVENGGNTGSVDVEDA
ncbi:hypothetical protein BDR04DRAFT_1110560 [Suillus decipiens]|nr:hypothetical protein BDR04DRAFT_1110560 [Suillus decipiens]